MRWHFPTFGVFVLYFVLCLGFQFLGCFLCIVSALLFDIYGIHCSWNPICVFICIRCTHLKIVKHIEKTIEDWISFLNYIWHKQTYITIKLSKLLQKFVHNFIVYPLYHSYLQITFTLQVWPQNFSAKGEVNCVGVQGIFVQFFQSPYSKNNVFSCKAGN